MARVFSGARALMAAATAMTASAESAATTAAPTRRGFLATLPVSPAMCKFLGVPEISHPAALKKIWEHIKAHNLQHPRLRKIILCDDALMSIFDGRTTVAFSEISRLMAPHFIKS